MTVAEWAEDIAEAPDPAVDPGPPETDDDVTEAQRLMDDAEEKSAAVSRDVRAQGDWDLRGDD